RRRRRRDRSSLGSAHREQASIRMSMDRNGVVIGELRGYSRVVRSWVWWRSGLAILVLTTVARADRQVIAPGTGPQDAVVVDSGTNGVCETSARGDDLQATPVGQGAPFQGEIRCGPDKIANTSAAGDDTQLVPVGSACDSGGQNIIDTGADGVANTTAAGDDVQAGPVGRAAPHAPCVETRPNRGAATPLFRGGDLPGLAKGAPRPHPPRLPRRPN